jgi:hypothetical protein
MKNAKFVLFVLTMSLIASCGPATEADAQAVDEGQSIQIGTTTQALSVYKQTNMCWANGHMEAVCDVYCPAGYIATGGGCGTSSGWWKVVESVPLGSEGWRCRGHEDHGSEHYYQSVTGYVVCLRITP